MPGAYEPRSDIGRGAGSGEDPLGPESRDVVVQTVDVRHAAAKDDDVRIEHVDHARQRSRHAPLVSLNRCHGRSIATIRRERDLGRQLTPPGAAFVVCGHSGAGQKRLDAPTLAAVTRRARTLIVIGPRQGVVTPLARNAVGAAQHLPAHDDACAGAGPDDDAKDDVRTRGRTIGRFRHCKAVGVVCDSHAAPETRLEIDLERSADQPRRVGVLDETGGCDGARDTDADSGRGPGGVLQIGNECNDGIKRRRVVVARRVDAKARALTTPVEGNAFDLRAAEIDPYAHVP